jgi:glutathione S-transferase
MPEAPILLSGAPGSPYTRKMLAVLRYRRLPYRFMVQGSAAQQAMPQPKVQLLPTFYLPGPTGELEAVTDSSPLIRHLEAEHEGRSVLPHHPALAFLNSLIEDYADEWLTKAMFHYRWSYAADIEKAGNTLPAWRGYSIPDGALGARAAAVRERQIGRLYVVGSNPVTGPVIEAGYRRFLAAFEAVLREQPFVLGARPSSADFALYGQLTQLAAFDPTPVALTGELAPRVAAWTGILEDLSGLDEGDWLDPAALPAALKALLAEIGRVYPPVMLANAEAIARGGKEFETTVEGQPWRQPTFAYQAKCLLWLRNDYADLAAPDRALADAAMAGTGLPALFQGL